MARTKSRRIAGVQELKNVFSFSDLDLDNPIIDHFKKPSQFTLEIGCGSGDYSIELGIKYPERKFVGIDVKAARIFNGASKAKDMKLDNVTFIIARAENLNDIFPEKSIEEIYIPFPDPHIRRANHNRRLISPGFLRIYSKLLISNGKVHFKTDNIDLYDYALKTITEFGCKIVFKTSNLYKDRNEEFTLNIKTSFESHYIKQGRDIRYICFQF